MTKIDYQMYLLSAHWRIFRERVLLRSIVDGQYKCEECGGLFRRCEMEVHHKHYGTLGCESLSDVLVLCGLCHTKTHGHSELQKMVEMDSKKFIRLDSILSGLLASAFEGLTEDQKLVIALASDEQFDAIKREFLYLLSQKR